jgi:hypothetical protein
MFCTEGGRTILPLTVGKLLQICTASHPRRRYSLWSPPWEPQISVLCIFASLKVRFQTSLQLRSKCNRSYNRASWWTYLPTRRVHELLRQSNFIKGEIAVVRSEAVSCWLCNPSLTILRNVNPWTGSYPEEKGWKSVREYLSNGYALWILTGCALFSYIGDQIVHVIYCNVK